MLFYWSREKISEWKKNFNFWKFFDLFQLLDQALADPVKKKFINSTRLEEFRGFGGVRLEDDVIVWENGVENMSAGLPRTVEEIEKFMNE